MEHVVFFPAHDGTPAFRRLASLEEAVRFVEHLRNTEGVDQVSVHGLTDVPLSFKAYYRVEVPTAVEAVAPVVGEPVGHEAEQPVGQEVPQPAPATAEAVVPGVVPQQEQPAEAQPAPRSLGFFAR